MGNFWKLFQKEKDRGGPQVKNKNVQSEEDNFTTAEDEDEKEFQTLMKNCTWKLVDSPKDKNIFSYECSFTKKPKVGGAFDNFKPRIL